MENLKPQPEENKEKPKYKIQLPSFFDNPDGTHKFDEFSHDIEYQPGTLLFVKTLAKHPNPMIIVKTMSENTKNLIKSAGSGAIPLEDIAEPSDEQILLWCKDRMSETETENFLDKQHDLIKKALR